MYITWKLVHSFRNLACSIGARFVVAMLNDSLERSFVPRRHSNLSDLEKNCSQIFVKGPAITREFFEKINNDVVPQKTAFFGYQMNTRRVIGEIFFLLFGLLV